MFLIKRLITIGILFCISVGVVICVFFYSKQLNHRSNSFTRLFPPHFLSDAKILPLKYNSFYLAGYTNHTIFLGNSTAAVFVLKANYNLTDSGHFLLEVPKTTKIIYPSIKVIIDTPDIFMIEGITPRILHGVLKSDSMTDTKYLSLTFDQVTLISKSSMGIKTFDPSLRQNILAKTNLGLTTVKRFPDLLTKNGDGIFSLDGIIASNRTNRRLIYVYFYKNQFIYLDTNFNPLLKGKTIDSITVPHIKLSRINSQNAITFSAPPLVVNKSCFLDTSLLYINSGMRARNETEEIFNDNSVIDIYNLKNGEYIYSFYVPDNYHKKVKEFFVCDHRLVALYDNALISFKIQY
jgi:hypothetical protein